MITPCKLEVITAQYDHRTLTLHDVYKTLTGIMLGQVPLELFYCWRRTIPAFTVFSHTQKANVLHVTVQTGSLLGIS